MEIKTKYTPGQEVWFLAEHRIVKGDIVNVSTISNRKETEVKYSVSWYVSESNIVVNSIPENNLFSSRKELIEKLCG